ncbi:hypothetical protein [Roseovarius ramblicola]|uniref:Uncharacterized protein n=1 Tax=Roseovarius ramblicola TaxID=2022336 RepID=A0ABV5HZV3_9RHOB
MFDLRDTLGTWIAAFEDHDEACPFLEWAQQHLDEPVTVIATAPAGIILAAPMRALADMRNLFGPEEAVWFADLIETNTHSRAIARWARARAND